MRSDHSDLEELAGEKEDENWAFRKFLKFHDDISGKELDRLVFKIADEVGSTIECTSCGRCCKELKPMFSDDEQQLLAKRLAVTVEQLRQQYLEYDTSDDEPGWQIKTAPCPFLKDDKCTVYEDRPSNCRDYPYLHKPDFSDRTWGMIERTFTCPIVFHVMEKLKEKFGFEADGYY